MLNYNSSADTGRTVLFNHIPKTGGVTLRVILNRVYGTEKVFLINSRNVRESLETYKNYTAAERDRFRVITGHGAEMLAPLLGNPFRITTVREPVSLFLSQFYYLKTNAESGFFEEVSPMEKLEEYLDFALEKGQDNLLTRYLSDSVRFLADPSHPVPAMKVDGEILLGKAISALHNYDAIIDVADFDAGIFALSYQLKWKRIPVYRQANINRANPGLTILNPSLEKQLKEYLKYDLALYDLFVKERLGLGFKVDKSSPGYRAFGLRQKGINFLSSLIGRK